MGAAVQRLWPLRADASQPLPSARRVWSVEGLLLIALAGMVALLNQPFWHAALAGRQAGDWTTWRFVACAALALVGLQALPLLLLASRATLRPLLLALLLCSLVAQHMMGQYGVVLDPPMLRNALRTDWREASELMTAPLLLSAVLALAAGAWLWRLPLQRRPWRQALGRRVLVLLGVAAVTVLALLAGWQDFSSLMRNQKALRYTITPANVVYSTGRALATDVHNATRQAEPLRALQAVPSPIGSTGTGATGGTGRKPRLLVMVVGETARAMNFSLNGYERPTNPELAGLPLINFSQTSACGTSTEVSLPCMFSSYGRADYDEDRIHASESLVQLLARAGVRVLWLDNQSGCKGVCAGLPYQNLSTGTDPALCPGGRCYDGVLVQQLGQTVDQMLADTRQPMRDTVVVLHQLGNHGPAYNRRYPAEFERFEPECRKHELRDCSRAEIVNAYDNAILYTDHLLAQTVKLLAKHQDRFDVGMLYASDHGESLGEKGLYLHGMPYAIAPREQLAVPMLWWLGGQGVQGWNGLDAACLRRRAQQPAAHDNLYHSVLGLMGVRTDAYRAERDIVSACKPHADAA